VLVYSSLIKVILCSLSLAFEIWDVL